MSIADNLSQTKKIQFRYFTEENKQLFTRNLINVEWEDMLTENDVNRNFEIFFNKFHEIYDAHFPIKTKNLSLK